MKMFIASIFISSVALAGSVRRMRAPNDPMFNDQWALHNDGSQVVVLRKDNYHAEVQKGRAGEDIGYLRSRAEVQKRAKAPVIVAVIDSGIDLSHPDLKGRILKDGYDFLPPVPRYNGQLEKPAMNDEFGHGTEIAGEIAANSDNGIGIAGIAPDTVKILPLRIYRGQDSYFNFRFVHKKRGTNRFDVVGKFLTHYVAKAIQYAVLHGASIINLSTDWPNFIDSKTVLQAFRDANKAGVLIVTGAGNDRSNSVNSPCDYEGVICVGAITNTGKMAFFSNYGGDVDVLAPGQNVLTTFPLSLFSLIYRVQGYELASGTSYAVPEVTALAAILKSIYPNISPDELRARIFASTGTPPSITNNESSHTIDEPASLYGLINIKKAIDVKAKPVFYPLFKKNSFIKINESTLYVRSQLTVDNLWAPAHGVTARILINGQLAGEKSIATLNTGASFVISWSTQLPSLSVSNVLHLELEITDRRDLRLKHAPKTFFDDVRVVRNLAQIKSQRIFDIKNVSAQVFLAPLNNVLRSAMSEAPTYGLYRGLPAYYATSSVSAKTPFVAIYDPLTLPNEVSKVELPGLQKVKEVFRLDVNRNGQLDWVIVGTYMGLAKDPSGQIYPQKYLQFRFYNPKFQPLWGSRAKSTWQVPIAGPVGTLIEQHSFAAPASWLFRDGRLVPCFMASGILPPGDNFDTLDIRFGKVTNHIYYLQPGPAGSQFVPLTVRALDNAKFRDPYQGEFTLTGWLLPNAWDLASGDLRAMAIVGQGWGAKTYIFDAQTRTLTQTNLDGPAAVSQGFYVLSPGDTGNKRALVEFDGSSRGSLTWVNSKGESQGRTDFAFKSPENPIVQPGLLGLFQLPTSGRVWFVESQFDLMAFSQSTSSVFMSRPISIDRNSNFSSGVLAAQFAPVIVGTSSNPLPGIYMDLSLIHRGYLTVATWNPQTRQLQRSVRYTLLVPNNCAEMRPVELSAGVGSFTIPLFCENGSRLQFRLVQP